MNSSKRMVVLIVIIMVAVAGVFSSASAARRGGPFGTWVFAPTGTGLKVPWVKPVPTIEQLTGGKVHTGEMITPENLKYLRPYLSESFARMVEDGAQYKIIPTTPPGLTIENSVVKATLANAGKAVISKDGTVTTKDGKPWIGGFPAAYPKTAIQVMANYQLLFADQGGSAVDEWWISPNRKVYKHTQLEVLEDYMNSRTCVAPFPVVPGHEKDKLFVLIHLLDPYDVRGLSVLTRVYNDQSKLPDSWGYVPVLRRVQRFSTAQRYDSIDGSDTRTGDINGFNDPLGLWSFRLVTRKPMLFPLDPNYHPSGRGKLPPLVKGMYPHIGLQVRDVWIIEAIPKNPDYIYSKKLLYIDSASYMADGDFYDKQGKLWLDFEGIYGVGKNQCGYYLSGSFYFYRNFQTGGETLASVYWFDQDTPNITPDQFTPAYLPTLAR